MPWRCEACDAVVEEDDRPCPGCGAIKAAWTVVQDKTRTFSLTAKRFQVKKGATAEPLPSGEPQQAVVERVEASEVRALPKVRARGLSDAGAMPDAEDVLFVELHQRKPAPATVNVTVDFDRDEPAERAFDVPVEATEVRLLCVHGPGDVEGLDFPGLQVLDVSDATGAAHAPSIEVAAFKKPPRPVQVLAAHSIELLVQDEAGEPLAEQRLVLIGPDGAREPGVTDVRGLVRWDDLEEGAHHVAFEDDAFVADVVPAASEDDAEGDGVPDAEELGGEDEHEGKLHAPPPFGEHMVEVLVKDDRGALLPGARLVLLRPDGTRDVRAADDQGVVRWVGLPDDDYHVAFEDDSWVADVEPEAPLEEAAAADDAEEEPRFTDELEGHESPAARRLVAARDLRSQWAGG